MGRQSQQKADAARFLRSQLDRTRQHIRDRSAVARAATGKQKHVVRPVAPTKKPAHSVKIKAGT